MRSSVWTCPLHLISRWASFLALIMCHTCLLLSRRTESGYLFRTALSRGWGSNTAGLVVFHCFSSSSEWHSCNSSWPLSSEASSHLSSPESAESFPSYSLCSNAILQSGLMTAARIYSLYSSSRPQKSIESLFSSGCFASTAVSKSIDCYRSMNQMLSTFRRATPKSIAKALWYPLKLMLSRDTISESHNAYSKSSPSS